jgi:hypothetical protein
MKKLSLTGPGCVESFSAKIIYQTRVQTYLSNRHVFCLIFVGCFITIFGKIDVNI